MFRTLYNYCFTVYSIQVVVQIDTGLLQLMRGSLTLAQKTDSR